MALVYITELSPATLRDFVVSFLEILISFGILLSAMSPRLRPHLSGLPNHINWHVMLVANILLSISIAFVLLVLVMASRTGAGPGAHVVL